MAKHTGVYKSNKRKKELLRLKKQEEKRKRRFNKNIEVQKDSEMMETREN